MAEAYKMTAAKKMAAAYKMADGYHCLVVYLELDVHGVVLKLQEPLSSKTSLPIR